jgi:hypothetical protein
MLPPRMLNNVLLCSLFQQFTHIVDDLRQRLVVGCATMISFSSASLPARGSVGRQSLRVVRLRFVGSRLSGVMADPCGSPAGFSARGAADSAKIRRPAAKLPAPLPTLARRPSMH